MAGLFLKFIAARSIRIVRMLQESAAIFVVQWISANGIVILGVIEFNLCFCPFFACAPIDNPNFRNPDSE